MPSPAESRAQLELLTTVAIEESTALARNFTGTPEVQRAALLTTIPTVVSYYSDGSSALAADFYEERRELAGVRSRFRAQPVVLDRGEKIRRAVVWAAAPLFLVEPNLFDVRSRLAEVVQLEVARPYRDTITANRRRDPDAVGWRRITRGGCKFCRMLADRGAVYKQASARFAAHPNCHCTAEPVFTTNDTGVEASVLQYKASRRSRTAAQRAEVRDYLNTYYEDFPG